MLPKLSQNSLAGSEAEFLTDLLLRSAIERQFETIGEATNRLRIHDLEIAERINEHRRIIAFRNVLSHGYDSIDDETTWRIITNKLPILLRDIETIIAGLESSG